MSYTIYVAKFEQTIIHQHVPLRQESQCTSVTIILCLHVLIARRISLILDMSKNMVFELLVSFGIQMVKY
jgi:hypothetical protein